MGMLRHTVLALAALFVPSLAACGGETAAPAPPPTHALSPSMTPSATVGPPPRPHAAMAGTIAGAKAFVRYYTDLITYAELTLDTAPVEAASLPTCTGCWGGINSLKKFRQHGDQIKGAHLSVRSIVISPIDAHGVTTVFFDSLNTKETVIRPGEKALIHPAGRNQMIMTLVWQDHRWAATQYEERN